MGIGAGEHNDAQRRIEGFQVPNELQPTLARGEAEIQYSARGPMGGRKIERKGGSAGRQCFKSASAEQHTAQR